MAHALTDLPNRHPVRNAFSAIGRGLVAMMENDQRIKSVAHLRNLSDAELADRGIRRDDIVRHVFSGAMYL